MSENDPIRECVQRFYDQHPYPPPVKDLNLYRQRWQDDDRRRADFHLHWPHHPYRGDLSILVAGCGTSQAAKHALRQPTANIVGIDFSVTSIHHTLQLKHNYNLENLEVHQLPIEHANELGRSFDKIICTGVLHHLPDPSAGLRALREVLEPDGVMHLMIYAVYGRAGVYMLQKYARLLGVGDTDKEINDFANTLMALPQNHPLAQLLGGSPDFRTRAGLADALLNPQDRAYTVPQLFHLISEAGLQFGRWIRQAPYLPKCGAFAKTPHASRLTELSEPEQFAALELLRGTMSRHSLVTYRDDRPDTPQQIHFDGDDWLNFIPIRLPNTICVQERLPSGSSGVLINQDHTYPDLVLPIDAYEKELFDLINGRLSIAEIVERVAVTDQGVEQACVLFEQLWWYDQVVFDISTVG